MSDLLKKNTNLRNAGNVSNYNSTIDFLKGILILCVVIYHIFPPKFKGVIYILSYFQMPLFLALFGYFIKYNSMNHSYLLYRIKKLMIPFISTSVLYYCISHIIYYKDIANVNTFIELIKIFVIPTTGHPHLWFLYAVTVHLVIIYLLSQLLSLKSMYRSLPLFLIIGALIDYAYPNNELIDFRRTFGWFIFSYLGFLYSNYLIPNYALKNKTNNNNKFFFSFLITAYLCFSIAKIYIDFFTFNSDTIKLLSSSLFILNNSLLISLILIFASTNCNLKNIYINYFGKNTMTIYLFHPLSILFCTLILQINNIMIIFLIAVGTSIILIYVQKKSKVLHFMFNGRAMAIDNNTLLNKNNTFTVKK